MMDDYMNIGLLCGVVFLIAAALMKFFPPRKINSLYGYRTSRSMQSDAHWQFAQRYSTVRMFEAALFLLAVGLVMETPAIAEKVKNIVGFVALLCVPVYLIVRTERALKIKFPK